jgi:hypothetical protein
MMEIIMVNLEKQKEAEEAAAKSGGGGGGLPANKSGLQSENIFNLMSAFLAAGHGADVIKKVNGTFGFNVLKKKGGKPVMTWDIDLKNGKGHVIQRQP